MSALTSAGEHLAAVAVTATTQTHAAAHQVLTAAMSTSRLLRPVAAGDLTGHAVALYNPFTAQISYRAPDGPVVFALDTALALTAAGCAGSVAGAPGSRVLTLTTDSVRIQVTESPVDSTTVARALAAYA